MPVIASHRGRLSLRRQPLVTCVMHCGLCRHELPKLNRRLTTCFSGDLLLIFWRISFPHSISFPQRKVSTGGRFFGRGKKFFLSVSFSPVSYRG